ncbi:hypothetical protein AYI69_g2253 [Smittium culicis]|uniref:Uncharacterized protein n=1 Tax=Smittium culicis TaxID=133412 RepID=A0A1R1YNG7_9FUNG|nr:hypothetical protein AYI69_g2253 [Smittium culicis]
MFENLSTSIYYLKNIGSKKSAQRNKNIGLGITVPKPFTKNTKIRVIKEKISTIFGKPKISENFVKVNIKSRAERIPFFYQKEYVEMEIHPDILFLKSVTINEKLNQYHESKAPESIHSNSAKKSTDKNSSETLNMYKSGKSPTYKYLSTENQFINNIELENENNSDTISIEFTTDKCPKYSQLLKSAASLETPSEVQSLERETSFLNIRREYEMHSRQLLELANIITKKYTPDQVDSRYFDDYSEI